VSLRTTEGLIGAVSAVFFAIADEQKRLTFRLCAATLEFRMVITATACTHAQ